MDKTEVSVSWYPKRQSSREKGEKLAREVSSNPEAIEYQELRFYDIHGYAKGRLLCTASEPSLFKTGSGLPSMMLYNGVKSQLNLHPDLWENIGNFNYTLVPIMSTLKPCMKAVRGNRNIATVLCELRFGDGTVENRCPRKVALAQLDALKQEFQSEIKSTFEAEFGVTDSATEEPLASHHGQYCSIAISQHAQEILLDLTDAMEEIGIKIDTLQAECGSGQFEATFAPVMGIEAVDMAADFKTSSFVYMQKKGFNVEFMTCEEANSFNYNFSIWDQNGRNAFVDPDDPRKLSKFGRHWLAGMVEHSPAMLALSSPTINCYRRIGVPFCPTFANWGQENRHASFRLKIEPEANIYIENRLPSSACNPYLVLASTVAAGMDGVRRKLELPQPMDESRRLPTTLEEALEALGADRDLKAALGEKMVEMFIYTKRTFEVEEFKSFGELSDEEKLLKEKEYYYFPI